MSASLTFLPRPGALLRHPLTLVTSLALGAGAGLTWPGLHSVLRGVTGLYLNLLQMAALPLVVAAILLGLLHFLALPRGAARLALCVALGAIAMALAAAGGALLALVVGAGAGLAPSELDVLGGLSLAAEQSRLSLHAPQSGAAPVASVTLAPQLSGIVPHSFLGALATGTPAGVLFVCLAFGVALAAQPAPDTRVARGMLETVYLAGQVLIDRCNLALPVVAFALAATAVAGVGAAQIALMTPLLGTLALVLVLLAAIAALVLACHLRMPVLRVGLALREPLTIGLFDGSGYGVVPGLIEGLSSRLGLRRALVEFIVPVAPLFLRAGEAAYFAILAVFLASLHGRELSATDLGAVVALSVAVAWLSVGLGGARLLAQAGIVTASLDLPLDGVLAALVLVDVLAAGLRNLISVVSCCALVALVSRGLSGEAVASETVRADPKPLQLTFRRRELAAASVLALAAAALSGLAGLGLGLRRASTQGLAGASAAPPPAPGSIR